MLRWVHFCPSLDLCFGYLKWRWKEYGWFNHPFEKNTLRGKCIDVLCAPPLWLHGTHPGGNWTRPKREEAFHVSLMWILTQPSAIYWCYSKRSDRLYKYYLYHTASYTIYHTTYTIVTPQDLHHSGWNIELRNWVWHFRTVNRRYRFTLPVIASAHSWARATW